MAQRPVAFVRLSGPTGSAAHVETELLAAGFVCRRLHRPESTQTWLEASDPAVDADPTAPLPPAVLRRIETALTLSGTAFRVREYGTELREV